MDLRVIEFLNLVDKTLGGPNDVHIISGFRSPEYNRLLIRMGRGVARHSLHTVGKAIDIRVPGVDLGALRRTALDLQWGGVGYYSRSGFVHLDTAAHRGHQSSLYRIENTEIPYPTNYALRFHVSREGVSYWIHGRDVTGYPVSHDCVGLYDEEMQREYYGYPSDPVLADAKVLYEWALGPGADGGDVQILKDGPRVRIVGRAPTSP